MVQSAFNEMQALLRAMQVELGRCGRRSTGPNNTEAGNSRGALGILESIPESVDITCKGVASNFLVISLGVIDRGNGLARGWASCSCVSTASK